MYLELESVFNNPGETLPFAFTLQTDLCPKTPVHGLVRNRAGVVTLEARLEVSLAVPCDRCAEPMVYRKDVEVSHVLVTARASEESDALVLAEFHFQPESLLWEDIVLSMPPKFLCRPNCKGLCARCGGNLNAGPCACKPEQDPRLAQLRKALEGQEQSKA
jgi:uncharacterized protein